MKKSSAILIVLLVFSLGIFAQKSEPDKTVKENGWKMPSMDGLVIANIGTVTIQGEKIYAESFKLKKPNQVQLEDFFTEKETSKFDKNTYLEMRNLEAYYSNYSKEKVFAYRIVFIPFRVTEQGVKNYGGILRSFFYVDEDDNGIFETRTWELKTLPDWVKNNN